MELTFRDIENKNKIIEAMKNTIAEQQKEIDQLKEFVRDCYMNWDCDSDAHKYNTVCRACEAEKLYKAKRD